MQRNRRIVRFTGSIGIVASCSRRTIPIWFRTEPPELLENAEFTWRQCQKRLCGFRLTNLLCDADLERCWPLGRSLLKTKLICYANLLHTWRSFNARHLAMKSAVLNLLADSNVAGNENCLRIKQKSSLLKNSKYATAMCAPHLAVQVAGSVIPKTWCWLSFNVVLSSFGIPTKFRSKISFDFFILDIFFNYYRAYIARSAQKSVILRLWLMEYFWHVSCCICLNWVLRVLLSGT